MRIILSSSKDEAIQTVAETIIEKISSHPASVIGLATGRTMEPVYEAWMRSQEQHPINLRECFFFMLDEYYGLPENHPSSFRYYIETHVLKPLKLTHDQFAFPPVHVSPNEGGIHYEQSIKESGGIDLQLLGIGRNGHIGFNEPGSLKTSRTRQVKLTPETIEANKEQFVDDRIPSDALSMGIETIMSAKNLLMLVTGSSKADVIKYLLNHHDDPSCPATYLKSHPHFTLVLDPEAASKINLKI